jgi:hypothetical protein
MSTAWQGLAVLGAALLLSGCAKALEVGSITEIQPTTGSPTLDVLAPIRAADPAQPALAGEQLVEVRSYAMKQGSGETEFPGAACTLTAPYFQATMVTPAKVRVPLYRNQSSTLAVACDMAGYQRRMVTLSPFDATRDQRLASGTNGGLLGVVAVAAIDALSDNSKNDWVYPPAKVLMEPGAAAQ